MEILNMMVNGLMMNLSKNKIINITRDIIYDIYQTLHNPGNTSNINNIYLGIFKNIIIIEFLLSRDGFIELVYI